MTWIRSGILFATGAILLQSAWILAVPPYRGSDEFDHVYRASSVAEGFWTTWDRPDHGRGDLIPVRRPIIEAGREICLSYKYVGPDNCRVVAPVDDRLATVASAASRYHPAFYWIVGQASRWGDGAQAVYAMRWLSAVLCSFAIGVVAALTAARARSRLRLSALSLALTPVLIYSTSLPAPNGIEMVAGLGLWTSILGLGPRRAQRIFMASAIGFAVVLTTVRSLGPLWVAIVLGTALLAAWPDVKVAAARDRRLVLTGLGLISIAGLGSIAWIQTARTYVMEQLPMTANSWVTAVTEIPVWIFQSIAAAPLRSLPAPMLVYAVTLVPFALFVFAGLIAARNSPRLRVAIILCGALSLLVPVLFTGLTADTSGTIWQGRYTLPYSGGLLVLAGLALDRASFRHPLAQMTVWLTAGGILIAHVVSVAAVQLREERSSPLSGDDRWMAVPLPVVCALAATGIALWCWATLNAASPGVADDDGVVRLDSDRRSERTS